MSQKSPASAHRTGSQPPRKPSTEHIEPWPGLRPTFSPELLGPECCQDMKNLVAACVADWSADLHYDEQGQAAIVVAPDDLDDATGPSFIVYADKAAFHLDEWRGDAYRAIGEHRTWSDCLRAVRIVLMWEMPCPSIRH